VTVHTRQFLMVQTRAAINVTSLAHRAPVSAAATTPWQLLSNQRSAISSQQKRLESRRLPVACPRAGYRTICL